MKNLEPAAQNFVEAVYAKRDVDESQFYGDSAIDKAYGALINELRKAMPQNVEWSYEVFDLCMGYGEKIRREHPDLAGVTTEFTRDLQGLLAHVSRIEWIACVPLERIFRKFPAFSNFGSFVILNPAGTEKPADDQLLDSFRTLLAERCGVTFATPRDPYNNESYSRLGEHYLSKSGHYIPGRPLLVVKLGRGEEYSNQRQLEAKLREIVPMIQLCQVAINLDPKFRFRITGSHSRLPDGKMMDDGLIAVPAVALALEKSSGNCGWWGSGISLYETGSGDGYTFEEFQQVWQDIAQPILEFRELSGANKCRLAVDNALRLISRCRHEQFADATVNAVIATETILNPFNPAGDIKERFALMTSALTESSIEGRRAKYLSSKELYNYRCDAVHRSRFFSDERKRDDHRDAILMFLACLKSVVEWGTSVLKSGAKLDQAAFDRFFVENVIR